MACPDGAWSAWSQWTNCSKMCGGGFHTRSRSCDNPTTSIVERSCVGSPFQVEACNNMACPAFTATNCGSYGSPLIFNRTSINVGGGYSTTTGKFTCQYLGLYYFTANIVKHRSSSSPVDEINALIAKNGEYVARIFIDPNGIAEPGSYAATGSVTLQLVKGDYVYVRTYSSPYKVESWSSFSGFLLSTTS